MTTSSIFLYSSPNERVSINTESYASEFIEILEEMFSQCYTHSDVCISFNYTVLPVANLFYKNTLDDSFSIMFYFQHHCLCY